MDTFSKLFLMFVIYSVLGWCCECVYCSIPAKHFVNRGFLNGPVCPVYGFGGILVLTFLTPVQDHLILLFLCAVLLTSSLEYLTAYLLERMFHTKWWDYSAHQFNLNGRVCLVNSLEFGILAVFATRILHPFLLGLVDRIPVLEQQILTCALMAAFFVDTTITVFSILKLNGKLRELQQVLDEIQEKNEVRTKEIQKKIEDFLDAETKTHISEIKERLVSLREREHILLGDMKLFQRRIISAFPNMKSLRHNEPLNRMKEVLQKKRKK